MVVLLLDVTTKRFELVVMDHVQNVGTDCFNQIPVRAKDPFLKQQQEYIGFCDPFRMTTTTTSNTTDNPSSIMFWRNDNNHDDNKNNNNNTNTNMSFPLVLVAIPKDKNPQDCVTLARSILATSAVVQTVRPYKHIDGWTDRWKIISKFFSFFSHFA